MNRTSDSEPDAKDMGARSVPTLDRNGAQSNAGRRTRTRGTLEAGMEPVTQSGTDTKGRGEGSPVLSLCDAENDDDQRQSEKRKTLSYVQHHASKPMNRTRISADEPRKECLASQGATVTRDKATAPVPRDRPCSGRFALSFHSSTLRPGGFRKAT